MVANCKTIESIIDSGGRLKEKKIGPPMKYNAHSSGSWF